MSGGRIRQPLRMLLLPTRAGAEASCGRALRDALTLQGISSQDFLSWVALQLDEWRVKGCPSRELRHVVNAVILAACSGASSELTAQGTRLAAAYFDLHQKLMDEHLMQHEEAIAFLSHSFLAAHLSSVEKLSAAQIANLLSQRDRRAKFSRQSVDATLQAMRPGPNLTLPQVVLLYRRDASQELPTLADAGLLTAAEIVAEVGVRLGFPGDLLRALAILTPTTDMGGLQSAYTPYLQMLHYQCSIAEFYDHAVTDIYEFSPRGEKGEWLHHQYPHSIAGAANPFLNNAKSVEVVDLSWVRSKRTRERPGAMALLTILEGMQAMGFFARRELAWWVRLWLHRVIRIAGMVTTAIPASLLPDQIERLLNAVRSGNTGTFGILEQRTVDAVAYTIHPHWRSRGIGDSVNATNFSRAKLGDCEFLDPDTMSIEAYESHGGMLSRIYVDEHIATLRKSILRRIDELSAIADPAAWCARITFVAHSIVGAIPTSVNIEGLEIEIVAMTFADFLDAHSMPITVDLAASIDAHLMVPLQEQRTPNEVRQALLAII